MMRRLPLLFAGAALIGGAWACDSLANPDAGAEDRGAVVSKVSGALVGDVPANTHVAVIWRKGEGVAALGDDAAVVDGHFTIDLAAPPSSLLGDAEADSPYGSSSSSGYYPTTAAGPIDASAGISQQSLGLRTAVSGSTITSPLLLAVAGFVVYADTNGNGKLDLDGGTGATTDQLLGGNDQLTLFYFKNGGDLDYVGRRDSTGHTPSPGYDLELSGNTGNAWVPLDDVELKLQPAAMPFEVCKNVQNIERGIDAGISYQCAQDGVHAVAVVCSESTGPSAGVCSVSGNPSARGCTYNDAGTAPSPMQKWWPCSSASDAGTPDFGNDASASYDAGPPHQ